MGPLREDVTAGCVRVCVCVCVCVCAGVCLSVCGWVGGCKWRGCVYVPVLFCVCLLCMCGRMSILCICVRVCLRVPVILPHLARPPTHASTRTRKRTPTFAHAPIPPYRNTHAHTRACTLNPTTHALPRVRISPFPQWPKTPRKRAWPRATFWR